MDFNEMFEKFKNNDKGQANINKGASLLEHLANSDMTDAFNMIATDGAIDGSFYILYKHLAEEGEVNTVVVPVVVKFMPAFLYCIVMI